MKRAFASRIALALLIAAAPLLAADPPAAYEMTTYYVGFLYKGSAWTPAETPELQKLQALPQFSQLVNEYSKKNH